MKGKVTLTKETLRRFFQVIAKALTDETEIENLNKGVYFNGTCGKYDFYMEIRKTKKKEKKAIKV